MLRASTNAKHHCHPTPTGGLRVTLVVDKAATPTTAHPPRARATSPIARPPSAKLHPTKGQSRVTRAPVRAIQKANQRSGYRLLRAPPLLPKKPSAAAEIG